MVELSELNLQLAFKGARTLREYVENEPDTVEHATL
jgi:hypothetical protein